MINDKVLKSEILKMSHTFPGAYFVTLHENQIGQITKNPNTEKDQNGFLKSFIGFPIKTSEIIPENTAVISNIQGKPFYIIKFEQERITVTDVSKIYKP
ncbi:MAG: hypothetical protein CMC15_18675 [Flavobacteriaceae bacterium]|nr:hypothetical protein [Flavobacteriaceae bacterium]|tara:strand:- start:379 stop:675 length:297 start_codon:yes stop_codon:yes gene_type:complete